MARIRTVKPEFWTDSKTGTLSPPAQCVFIALWNHVDDYGVIENDPLEVCARILPHRTAPIDEAFERPLAEIMGKRLVEAFTFDDRPYLWVRNFTKHQRIKNPAKPLLPDFEKHSTPSRYLRATGSLPESSPSPPGILPPTGGLPQSSPSRNDLPPVMERKGKEGKGVEWNGVERNGMDRKGEEGMAASASSAAAPGAPPPGHQDPVVPMSQIAAELGIPLELTHHPSPPSRDQVDESRRRQKAALAAREGITVEELEHRSRLATTQPKEAAE